jgi:hypothetical protein
MKKILAIAILFCAQFAGFAQTTTFTANTKDLATVLPATPEAGPVYLELTLKNCAGSGTTPTIPHVNGTGIVVFPVNLYPDGTGAISKTVYDQTGITCGSSTGVAYYHIRVYQGDNTRSLVKKLLFEDDFNVQGASFNLNSATPRSGSVISPPVATAVLTNPAGDQTIVQPGGSTLFVTGNFNVSGTGTFGTFSPTTIALPESTAPSGIAAKDVLYGDSTAHRLKVIDNNGTATTPALFTDNLSVFAATTSAQLLGVISDETGTGALVFANSPALVTPNIGAATGTSLNLGGTGVLSTTAQSGTGSHCMTTSCVMTTPNIGAATASSLIFNSAATGTGAALTVGGTSSTTGGISIFVGASGSQNERLSVVPADGSSAALRVGALSVRTPSAGFLTGTQLAGIDTAGAISGLSLALGGGTVLTTTNRTGTGNLVLATSPSVSDPTLTGVTAVKRIRATQGTSIVAGDFAISGGWGTTASVGSVLGTDAAFSAVVTSAGTGQSAGPTVTLTFHDGTWTNSPLCAPSMGPGNNVLAAWLIQSVSATALVLQATLVSGNFTPAATNTVGLTVVCVGR